MRSPPRILVLLGLLAAFAAVALLLVERQPALGPDLAPDPEPAAHGGTAPAPMTVPRAPDEAGLDEGTAGRPARTPGPATSDRLRGRVVDERDRPIPGAEVQVLRVAPAALRGAPVPDEGPLARATAERDGTFELPAPGRAWLRVLAQAPGFATTAQLVADAGTFVELRLGRAGALRVRVLAGDERPVAGATVEAVSDATRVRVKTGGDGVAALEALPAGDALLAVEAQGHGTVRAGPFPVEPGGSSEAIVVLPPIVRLAGQVVAAVDEGPVAGAEVLVARPGRSERADPTGPDGAFGPLDAGGAGERVFVSVHAPGFAPALEPVVLQGPGVQEVQVRLVGAEPWSGRVLTEAGAPAGGVAVGYTSDGVAGREPATARTDDAGRFTLPPPPPPAPGRRVVLYARSGDRSAALGLRPGMARPDPLVLVLQDGARVTGRVVQGDGAPRAGVQVRCVPVWSELEDRGAPGPSTSRLLLANEEGFPGLATATDADGRWWLEGLPPGPYEVRVRWAGAETWRPGVLDVGPSGADAGVLVLDAGRRVAGRVTDAAGAPLAGVTVRMEAAEGATRWRRTATDGEGRYAFPAVAPGVALLDARLGHLEPVRVRVTVTADRDRDDVDLAFEGGAVLAGRVHGPDGPYAGLLVLSLGHERGGRTESAAHAVRVEAGAFRWETAPIGRWVVHARVPGGAQAHTAEAVDVDAGRVTEVDLALEASARIEGSVRTASGDAVAGARVVLDAEDGRLRRLATADPAGRFAFPDLAPGRWSLEVHGRGGAPWREAVEIASGEDRDVAIRLPPGGTARVEVVDEQGRPVPDAVVLFRTPGGPLPVARPDRTGPDGALLRGDLPVGSVDVRARDAAGRSGEATVGIAAGRTAAVRVRIGPAGR